jgi:hypothetical protein
LTNLLEFFEEVFESKDEGKLVDVICLDLPRHLTKYLTKGWPKICKHIGLEGRY